MTANRAFPVCARAAPVILLPGWGCERQVLEPLARELARGSPVEVLDLPPCPADAVDDPQALLESWIAWLAERVPEGATLLGWSLGGALAMAFAVRHPERLGALVTVAASPCFRARDGWALGMPAAEFEAFHAGLCRDPQAQLRRFATLQAQGDDAEREVARTLRSLVTRETAPGELQASLDLLGHLDLRVGLARLQLPTLHVLGEHDRLVPAALEGAYRELQPRASVWRVSATAHAPFLSRPVAVAARIRDFLDSIGGPSGPGTDKREVARAFGRAAAGYEAGAQLQRDTGEALLRLLPCERPRRVLDLGCGTGHFTADLAARYPEAEVLGVDLAEGMLRHARAAAGSAGQQWLCGDAEALPLATTSVDLVFSNLVLQWCEASAAACSELARVLRPGAVAVISTVGPDTLWELRAAWRALDRFSHVNRFTPAASLAAAARASGLRVELERQELRVECHPDVRAVAAGLRQIGAHTLNAERRPGLSGRALWRQLDAAYAQFGDAGAGVPATWQLLYFVLRKPANV